MHCLWCFWCLHADSIVCDSRHLSEESSTALGLVYCHCTGWPDACTFCHNIARLHEEVLPLCYVIFRFLERLSIDIFYFQMNTYIRKHENVTESFGSVPHIARIKMFSWWVLDHFYNCMRHQASHISPRSEHSMLCLQISALWMWSLLCYWQKKKNHCKNVLTRTIDVVTKWCHLFYYKLVLQWMQIWQWGHIRIWNWFCPNRFWIHV